MVIRELFRLRILFENGGSVAFVHVTQGNDVLVFHLAEIMAALAAKADAGEVKSASRQSTPFNPSTPLGTSMKPAVDTAAPRRNWRRVSFVWERASLVLIMPKCL